MDKDTEKAMFRLLSMLARMQLVEAIERRHDLAARQLQHHVLWLNRVQAKFYEPAAATPAPSWNGGPTVTALMRGVEDAAIEWVKCVVDYNASCQAAPPPSGLEASEAVRKAGHKCELAYGYFQKAITALADHRATPAPSALERVRERVRAVAEAKADAGDFVQDETTRHAFGCVLRWIKDEVGGKPRQPTVLDRLRERVAGAITDASLDRDADPISGTTAYASVLDWIDEEKAKAGEAGNG